MKNSKMIKTTKKNHISPGVDQGLGVNHYVRVASNSWQTLFLFLMIFYFFALSLLFPFVSEKDVKKLNITICTIKQLAKKPFASQNTQHVSLASPRMETTFVKALVCENRVGIAFI